MNRPDHNSEGHLIHPTAAGRAAFWRWFGDSKVVDKQGRPLVVYHGTNADFSEFKKEYQRQSVQYCPGFFFGTEKKTAELYGDRVVEAYIRAVNGVKERRKTGLSIDHIHDKERGLWLVFDPTQIKSATGNRGTFDPADPVITNPRRRNPVVGFESLGGEEFVDQWLSDGRDIAKERRSDRPHVTYPIDDMILHVVTRSARRVVEWALTKGRSVIGAGAFGVTNTGVPQEYGTALAKKYRGKGLHKKVLHVLRHEHFKCPLESDKDRSYGNCKSWERAGGVLDHAADRYRLNPRRKSARAAPAQIIRERLYKNNASYALLLKYGYEFGWLDGGCWIAAEAIRRRFGGDLVGIYSASGLDHVAVENQGYLIDAEGLPFSIPNYLRRYARLEHRRPPMRAKIFNARDARQRGLPYDERLVKAAVRLLK